MFAIFEYGKYIYSALHGRALPELEAKGKEEAPPIHDSAGIKIGNYQGFFSLNVESIVRLQLIRVNKTHLKTRIVTLFSLLNIIAQ